jgi:hypothetical protein
MVNEARLMKGAGLRKDWDVLDQGYEVDGPEGYIIFNTTERTAHLSRILGEATLTGQRPIRCGRLLKRKISATGETG